MVSDSQGQGMQNICQGIEPFRKVVLGMAKEGILSKD